MCANIGKFLKKTAKKMDGLHNGLNKMTFDYKIMKADCADNHDHFF